MRKLAFLSTLIMVFALILTPAAAQEDEGNSLLTITEIVTNATLQEEPEFTTLLSAIVSSDRVFLQTLSDPQSVVTVFAPTDAAFDELIEALGTTRENLLNDRALLNNLLSYHIVPAEISSTSLTAIGSGYVGTLLRGEPLRINASGDTITINDSTVTEADLFASNGIIHVIDTVLAPPPAPTFDLRVSGTTASTIAVNSRANPTEFTFLRQAIEASDPGIFASLAGTVPYTLFAPTDAAFRSAFEQLGVTPEEFFADRDRVTNIMSYHIVPGSLTLADLLHASRVRGTGGSFRLATLIPSIALDVTVQDGLFMATYANVLRPDLVTSNGVIHVVDAVLIPPSS